MPDPAPASPPRTRLTDRQIGLLLTLLGAVFFSCKAIVIKLAYQDYPVPSIVLLGLRMAFSLPFFLGIGFWSSRGKAAAGGLTGRRFAVIVVLGIFGYYLASYTDFLGLRYLSAGMERIILFSYPTMVLVLQRIVFGTIITRTQVLATVTCYLGIALAFSGSDFSAGSNFALGAGLVLLSAFLYSFYVIGSGRLTPVVGSVRFTSVALVAAALAVLAHVFAAGHQLTGLPAGLYAYGLVLAVFCTVIPGYMVTAGIRRIGASDAAILGAVGPVATIGLEYAVLGETLNLAQGLGAVLVIGGVVLIGRSKGGGVGG